MATVSLLLANSSKTAGTTLDAIVPAGGVAAGTVLLVRAAWDNTTTGTTSPTPTGSVTDQRGNTYTKRGERGSGSASGSGIVGALFTCTVGTTLQAGDFVRLTLSASVTAKMLAVSTIQGAALNTSIAVASAGGVSATPSVSVTPLVGGQTVLALICREDAVGGTFTQDTDAANGTWANLSTQGSTGGNAQTNVSTAGAYKEVTASGQQTYNPSIGSTDWVAFAVVFDAVAVNYASVQADGLGLVDTTSRVIGLPPLDTMDIGDSLTGDLTADYDQLAMVDGVSADEGLDQAQSATDPLSLASAADGVLTGDSDPLGLADTVIVGGGPAVEFTVTDAVGLADTGEPGSVGYGEATSDPLGLADSVDAAGPSVIDPLGLDDDVTGQLFGGFDSLGLVDGVAVGGGLVAGVAVSDPVGIADTGQPGSVGYVETAIDLLGATDSLQFAHSVELADALGSGDATAQSASASAALSDVLGSADSVAPASMVAPVVSDPVGAVDSRSSLAAFSSEPTDALGVGDAASQTSPASREPTDASALTDVVTFGTQAGGEASVNDASSITDWVTADASALRDLADPLAATDVTERFRSLADSLTDGLTTADPASTEHTAARAQPDALAGSDDASADASHGTVISDACGFSDSLVVTVTPDRAIAEPLGLADAAAASASYVTSSLDGCGLVDSLTVTLVSRNVVLTDAAGLADGASTASGALPGLTDSAGLADAVVVQKLSPVFAGERWTFAGPVLNWVLLSPVAGERPAVAGPVLNWVLLSPVRSSR